jgi:hypothetical protein
LNTHKYSQISIPLYPNWDEIKKFIKFIKKLEEDIQLYIKNKKEWSSLINKKKLLNFIKANINDNIKITSNIENKKITIDDFKTNGQIDMVLKLSYIWSNLTKTGLSSQIYQIKYLAPPDQLNINFIDVEEKEIIYKQPEEIIYKQPEEIIHKRHIKEIIPDIPQPRIVLSLGDLQSALKKLKPVDK